MTADRHRSARAVIRFGGAERAVHATFGLLFLVLLATGLVQWTPSLSAAIGQRHVVKQVHVWAGIGLLTVPLAIAVAGDRRTVWRTARELGRFDREDRAFLRFRASTPGRFNGGQKANTVWTVLSAALFVVSGTVLWQWTRFDPAWRTGATRLHDLLTVVSVPVLVGHVYLAAMHPTTRASLPGAVTGRVDRTWAAAHHPRWAVGAATPRGDDDARPTGRRAFVLGGGAGVLAIVTGGAWLPRIVLPSSAGWRIYNVAGSMPDPADFALRVDGMVHHPTRLDLDDLAALARTEHVEDFECVTGWKVEGVRWSGVPVSVLLERAGVDPAATHVTFHARDGVYSDSLSLADARDPRTLLATGMDGDPLPRRHGGPARLVVPSMYGYKSVKWVGRIELTDHEHVGYWERRGYSRDARIDTSGRTPVYGGTRAPIPDLALSVLVPDGWATRTIPGGGLILTATNERPRRVEASVIATPRTAPPTREVTRSMLAELERAGLQEARYGAIEADGVTADTLSAADGSGQRFLFAFFPDVDRVVQVQGQAPGEEWTRWGPVFEQLAASLERTG